MIKIRPPILGIIGVCALGIIAAVAIVLMGRPADVTTGWKMYQDSANGIEFKYPAAWAIVEQAKSTVKWGLINPPISGVMEFSVNENGNSSPTDPISWLRQQNEAPYRKDLPVELVKTFTVNGDKGVITLDPIGESANSYAILLTGNDKTFWFSIEDKLEIVQDIAQSIRLTSIK